MKPKEFDELIRQKFDQNDFGYNPRNWEMLAEQLDGKARKRSIVMWWWMPLVGVAASVALAIGVTSLWRQAATGDAGVTGFASNFHFEKVQPAQQRPEAAEVAATVPAAAHTRYKTTRRVKPSAAQPEKEAHFGISLQNALSFVPEKNNKKFDLLNNTEVKNPAKTEPKKPVAGPIAGTFKKTEGAKQPKLSVYLSGGVNQGNQSSGYVAGATIRRMVNSKVFLESDVAFVSSNNTQSQTNMIPEYVYAKTTGAAANARTTQTTGVAQALPTRQLIHVPKQETDNYNLPYAQVAPAVGVQVMKKWSLAAGPDFQQALVDNRPAAVPASEQPFSNVTVMPLFDMGLIGKTEYSITHRIKAQLSYRKGINNILTPENKYIDRNYMQVQVRCAIFNK